MFGKIIAKYKKFTMTPTKYAKWLGVKLGKNTTVADKNHWSTEPYLIEIGSNCRIAKGVSFFTHGGALLGRERYPDFDTFGKIKVGNWVYFGANALIMPGVTIGNRVIVGAGSVVTKSIPDGMVVAGNPAKFVGTTDAFVERNEKYNVNSKRMTPEEKRNLLLQLSEDQFIKKGMNSISSK